jgi:hypothetical protein
MLPVLGVRVWVLLYECRVLRLQKGPLFLLKNLMSRDQDFGHRGQIHYSSFNPVVLYGSQVCVKPLPTLMNNFRSTLKSQIYSHWKVPPNDDVTSKITLITRQFQSRLQRISNPV